MATETVVDQPKTSTSTTVMTTPSPEPKTETKPEGTPEGKVDDKGATPEPKTEPKGESKETEGKDGGVKPPEVPDKYELTSTEGSPITAEHLEMFAAEARALGLTQEQAQNMVLQRETAIAETRERYLEELKADPELGGKNLETIVPLAVKGRDFLWPKDSPEAEVMNRFFEESGYGNHKVIVRAFARLGRLLSEDSLEGAGSGGKREKTEVELIYGSEKATS